MQALFICKISLSSSRYDIIPGWYQTVGYKVKYQGRLYEICTIHYARDIISLSGFRSKWFLNFNQITLTTWFQESYHRICHVTSDLLWCNIEPLNWMLMSVRNKIYPIGRARDIFDVLQGKIKARLRNHVMK